MTDEHEQPKRRGRPPKAKIDTTYVVCVKYPGEWEKLVAEVNQMEDHEPCQVIPMARLTDKTAVRAAFFVGSGDSRTVHITPPVLVKDHWSAGAGGFGGNVNRASFLEELGKLCMPDGGMAGGVSIKPGNDELRIAYG